MEKTAIEEINEMFLKLTSEEFYGWFWNNRERLLKLDKKEK